MLEDLFSTVGNLLCPGLGLAAVAIAMAECSCDAYDNYAPYTGAQPGPHCDYENTLPPTYTE